LREYVPDFSWGYRPWWSYGRGIDKAEAQAQAKELVAKLADSSAEVLQLTAIPEYLESLKVYADDLDDSPAKAERFRAANATMWRIEQEKKIKSGLAYRPVKLDKASEPTPPTDTPRTDPKAPPDGVGDPFRLSPQK
jgi:hypothetical protein